MTYRPAIILMLCAVTAVAMERHGATEFGQPQFYAGDDYRGIAEQYAQGKAQMVVVAGMVILVEQHDLIHRPRMPQKGLDLSDQKAVGIAMKQQQAQEAAIFERSVRSVNARAFTEWYRSTVAAIGSYDAAMSEWLRAGNENLRQSIIELQKERFRTWSHTTPDERFPKEAQP